MIYDTLRVTRHLLVAHGIWLLAAVSGAGGQEVNQVAGQLITLNTNGAWSWYMDERVIIDSAGGKLLASSVADASGTGGADRNGDIDVASYDLTTGQLQHFVLHDNLQADDHNGAALLVRPDGRYLAAYTKHNSEKLTYYRVSTNPHDASSWQPQEVFDWDATPGSDFNATYSNLFYLESEGRTYNFARANNRSPNMMLSMNDGDTWSYGGKLFSTPVSVGYVNGYLKYASNGVDRIDFIATEHHPRDFNNSIYHGYIEGGKLRRSDGTLVDGDIFDNSAPNQTALTKVFAADPENGNQVNSRAWTTDLHVDSAGNPYAIFTTRADDIPVNTNGYNDHRFWYARYDGSQWHIHQLAKAGARLYPSEQDYTGLVALDPHDPNTVYMSTPIDPRDEVDLGVHEIFKGQTADGGATWSWTPITFKSEMDNLRPTVPIWDDEHTALVWMRGSYRSMHDYDLDIVALTDFGPLSGKVLGDLNGDNAVDMSDFADFIAAMYTDLSSLTAAQAYAKGDLNGDFSNNAEDFILFRQYYDAVHGAGSLRHALAVVPEPFATVMVGTTATVLAICYRRPAHERNAVLGR
jgi:BNR repeat-containing family member